MSYICVYGSLRKDQYNFNSYLKRYGSENIEYVDTIKLKGYRLYSLGAYPGIKESKNGEELIVDILKVSSNVGLIIHNMELGAGYITKTIKHKSLYMTIFIYIGLVDETNLVESGDWSKHLKELV